VPDVHGDVMTTWKDVVLTNLEKDSESKIIDFFCRKRTSAPSKAMKTKEVVIILLQRYMMRAGVLDIARDGNDGEFFYERVLPKEYVPRKEAGDDVARDDDDEGEDELVSSQSEASQAKMAYEKATRKTHICA
jgi:hypothetical protein